MRQNVNPIMKHCLTGSIVSFYISLHPNSKTYYRGERSKSRYKENVGSYNIRQNGMTSYEDKEVTNENSKRSAILTSHCRDAQHTNQFIFYDSLKKNSKT